MKVSKQIDFGVSMDADDNAGVSGAPPSFVIDSTPSGAEELKAQGNTSYREGRFSEAVQHFTEAIALDPASPVLLSNRSGAYVHIGRYEAALADAESCLKLKPTWAKAHSRKGTALTALARYSEGSAASDKQIECLRHALTAYEDGEAADPSDMQIKEKAADVRRKLAGARPAPAPKTG